MMSAKWHNIKIWFRYTEGFDKPILRSHMPIVFDLGSDPGESYKLFNDKMDIGWEAAVVLPVVYEYEKSPLSAFELNAPICCRPAASQRFGSRANHRSALPRSPTTFSSAGPNVLP
jgi:hypothetical protein